MNMIHPNHQGTRFLTLIRRQILYETAAIKVALLLRGLGSPEWRYRPDQPRVPAGNPDGGQWTATKGR
jgi:hypothetical protein